jgi:hypothetical protein
MEVREKEREEKWALMQEKMREKRSELSCKS